MTRPVSRLAQVGLLLSAGWLTVSLPLACYYNSDNRYYKVAASDDGNGHADPGADLVELNRRAAVWNIHGLASLAATAALAIPLTVRFATRCLRRGRASTTRQRGFEVIQ